MKHEMTNLARIIHEISKDAMTEEQALQSAQIVKHLTAGALTNIFHSSKRLPESQYTERIQRDIQTIRDLFNVEPNQ
jgi:hypothetical protein